MAFSLQKLGLRTRLIASILASVVFVVFMIMVAVILGVNFTQEEREISEGTENEAESASAVESTNVQNLLLILLPSIFGVFLVINVSYSCWLGFHMRRKNEARRDRGQPVYLNRYSHNGTFKHYTLVVRNVKYELRLDPKDKTKSIFAFKPDFHFSANTAADETGQTGETGIETRLPLVSSKGSSYSFGGFLYHNLLFG